MHLAFSDDWRNLKKRGYCHFFTILSFRNRCVGVCGIVNNRKVSGQKVYRIPNYEVIIEK